MVPGRQPCSILIPSALGKAINCPGGKNMAKKYVWVNRPAGEYRIASKNKAHALGLPGRFSPEFGPANRSECEAWVESERIRTKAVAVFVNHPGREVYSQYVDRFSGNYKGSGHYPCNFAGEWPATPEGEAMANALITEIKAQWASIDSFKG